MNEMKYLSDCIVRRKISYQQLINDDKMPKRLIILKLKDLYSYGHFLLVVFAFKQTSLEPKFLLIYNFFQLTKRNLDMSNGLALTRSDAADKNELFFFIEDSHGKIISIKQTFRSKKGKQVKIYIEAPENVKISRGELLT